MNSIFGKTLYEKRGFMLGWTIGMLALGMLMASFYPAMHQEGGLDQLVKNLPAAFQGLVGNLNDLSQFDTYIASQLFDIRMPLIAGIMAIILGLGLSTREEESGELRTLLALPISRTKLLFEKWLAMIVIMLVISLGLVAGVCIILPFLSDASIGFGDMLGLAGMTLLVMTAYGSVTFAAGMASGKRSFAMAIGTLVIIGSFLLSTFGSVVDWLSNFEKLSLLHYFPAVEIVKEGIEIKDAAVLAAVVVVALAISWVLFRRRDVT